MKDLVCKSCGKTLLFDVELLGVKGTVLRCRCTICFTKIKLKWIKPKDSK